MVDMLIRTAQKMKPCQIIVISILASETLTGFIVSVMDFFLNGAVTPDFLITGAVAALIVSFIIVTIIVIALNRIRENEARYHQIFQQATDYILVLELSPEGHPIISDASDSAFEKHGYSREEMRGKPISFLDSEASRSQVSERMRLLTLNKHANFEAEHVRKDGGKFVVEVTAKMITINGKSVIYTIERDITERKKLEEHQMELVKQTVDALEDAQAERKNAEEANRLKSEFLANMSHELNTPLTSVLGYSRLANDLDRETAANMAKIIEIIDRSDDPRAALLAEIKSLAYIAREAAHETAKYDDIVLEQGEALFNMLNDLMDLSMLESGQIKVAEHVVSTYTLLAHVEKIHGETAKEKGLSFSVNINDFRPTDIVFLGDQNKLEKALNSLVQNAIKYSGKGEIHVAASIEDGNIVFRVKDEGVGIQDPEKEKIFETFRQLDGSSTRQQGGLGLGLSLARKLVHAMGGDIIVQSEVGKGSEFSIKLPYRPVLHE